MILRPTEGRHGLRLARRRTCVRDCLAGVRCRPLVLATGVNSSCQLRPVRLLAVFHLDENRIVGNAFDQNPGSGVRFPYFVVLAASRSARSSARCSSVLFSSCSSASASFLASISRTLVWKSLAFIDRDCGSRCHPDQNAFRALTACGRGKNQAALDAQCLADDLSRRATMSNAAKTKAVWRTRGSSNSSRPPLSICSIGVSVPRDAARFKRCRIGRYFMEEIDRILYFLLSVKTGLKIS